MYIDSHAHLDDQQFGDEVGDVVARARAAGVNHIVNIGYRPSVWVTTLALADRFPEIAYTLGLHPNHALEWSDEVERELIRLIESTNPVAIGEIGLDTFRDHAPLAHQEKVFRTQLEIASHYRLPVVIHMRSAEFELMHILADAPADLVCLLHSFDGTPQLAAFAEERGYYLGVGGLMTRSQATAVRSVLADYPIERLLLETDSPYLVPSGVKNRRNEPSNIPYVAQKLAELRGMTVEEVAGVTSANTTRLFPALLSATATTH